MITVDGISYGLSAADLADRTGYLNASEAPIICGGTPEKRFALWREKTGQAEPEDLSDAILVQFGSYSEAFNIHWLERKAGLSVIDRQKVVKRGHLRCTLDGMTTYQDAPCVVEAKFMSSYAKKDERIQWYMPQVFVQMHLTGARQAIITVLDGSPGHDWHHVEWDDGYAESVLRRLEEFWADVQFGTPPADAPALTAPAVSAFRPYDFSTNNEFVSHAHDWLENEAPAKKFKAAEKLIKELVPADASEVTTTNIIVKRSKAGALSIRSAK